MSCLPGYYSTLDATIKRQSGGPYFCEPCEPGTFAAAAGSTACTACPLGTYAVGFGHSDCTACALPGVAPSAQTTAVVAAYDPRQCVSCWPGTQNCTECVPGEYQDSGGQVTCIECPVGHACPNPNATSPTPCLPGTQTLPPPQ